MCACACVSGFHSADDIFNSPAEAQAIADVLGSDLALLPGWFATRAFFPPPFFISFCHPHPPPHRLYSMYRE